MLTRACLTTIALLMTMPAWSQAPSATTGSDTSNDNSGMSIPPTVSGEAIPTTTLSTARSNYLDVGLTVQPTYYDNLPGGNGSQPIGDTAYSIRPTIKLDELTPRLHLTWAYDPGFTIYQKTSARNEADQSASLALQYRLSEHATVSGQDNFLRSSNVFNQPDSLTGGQISGSPPSSPVDVVAPFAERLTNTANAELAYQFSMNGMIGAGGSGTITNYPNQAQSTGLGSSNSRGGSAFYNFRLSSTQSLGANYQYVRILNYPVTGQLEIQTHTVYLFYTATLGNRLTLSLSAGPQYFSYAQSPFPTTHSWTPAVTASTGWQGERTGLAASYSRTVSGGGGLLGAMSSNSASASATWRMTRTWDVRSTANYAVYKNESPSSLSSSSGGHSVSGTVTIDHTFSEHLRMDVGYQRLHQSYSGIAAIASDPDTDSEFASISYQFTRPLGR
jgi:hypothetical protein